MVSNDFTQVISDGVGAWVLNNGRAELVSVFTYYCAVGYLADQGGIIRATNGNNSYGNFGSVALGIDQNEVPKECNIDNRNNEAQVAFAFAGEITDKILAFEYKHCGEQYTTAAVNVVGSGNFIDVDFDDIHKIKLNSKVFYQTDNSPPRAAKILFISKKANEFTGSFKIEALVENPAMDILAGLPARLFISMEETLAHLVPASSILLSDNGNTIAKVVISGIVNSKEVSV